MPLTARQLNRATLGRQLLLHRERLDVRDAVRRLLALQAQEPASPYLALWNRLADFDPADLDAAFVDRTVVKASLIRLTLHAVHAEDYPTIHDAMVRRLRGSRLEDDRFTESGSSVDEVDAFLPHLLDFLEHPRTKAEIEGEIEAHFGEPRPRAWWALRSFAPLHHAPSGGPWSFGPKQSFVAAARRSGRESPDAPEPRLVRRYLEAFGPASAQDVAQFTILRRPVVAEALRTLADEVEEVEGPGGTTLYDVPGGLLPTEDTPAPPRLLPMWDSVLLAYADRSRIMPPDYRKLVIRINGDCLPTLLVDGYVAGVWRPDEGGIEASAFHRLSDEAWSGLETEARVLVAFLAERDPAVYRRYAHWWAKLPDVEARLLPG